MKTYYAEVTVTYSFEFGEDDMEGDEFGDSPDEFARAHFDEQSQGFDFDDVKVTRLT